jgi:hypothetical protein
MKKLLFLIILLLFPITVLAKTPNKEETFKVIKDISNVSVSEDVKIESTSIDDDNIIFIINDKEVKIPYTFNNNKLSFEGGIIDNGEIKDNDYAFYLYSILENKSSIPYDINNYYNNETIKEKYNEEFSTTYKESSNTFGITLEKIDNNKYRIIYDYYLDGDYPVIDLEQVSDDFTNPSTGNYNLLITIMLIAVLCIGVYTYVDPKKSN